MKKLRSIFKKSWFEYKILSYRFLFLLENLQSVINYNIYQISHKRDRCTQTYTLHNINKKHMIREVNQRWDAPEKTIY